jgi:uncharacterized protein YgbK (DUF1537 family)
MKELSLAEALAVWPEPWGEEVLPWLQRDIVDRPRKIWILDDDPTGTQTIGNLPVLTEWSVQSLAAEFEEPAPACFLLTNSRALTTDASRRLHVEIATNLEAAAASRPFSVISRSDSTLRGHFPLETDILASSLGGYDLLLLAPYFEAGGRITIDGWHYVLEEGLLRPAATTPFAQDTVFGYGESHLPRWVEEKTGGRVSAASVVLINLGTIRRGGPSEVAALLMATPAGSVVVADSLCLRDIEVVAAGVARAEAAGRRILARTAASFVAARVGQCPPPLLDAASIAQRKGGGLIVVGSYVPKTTEQLDELLAQRGSALETLQLDVADLVDDQRRQSVLAHATHAVDQCLEHGRDIVVFTSRTLVRAADPGANLALGQRVSSALVELVQRISVTPRYLIAKGGITSSDIATSGLGIRRATVLGQLQPGVPVWRPHGEARFPGMPLVIFPGNVGGRGALASAVAAFASQALSST